MFGRILTNKSLGMNDFAAFGLLAAISVSGVFSPARALYRDVPDQGAPDAGTAAPATVVEAALARIREGDVNGGIRALREAGEAGDPDGFFHLGEIHRLGVGRQASPAIATMFYRFAAGMGHGRASLSLANMLFFDMPGEVGGRGEALAIWRRHALQGETEALYMLGILYWNGDVGDTPDPIRGYGLVRRAADAGYGDAVEAELAMRQQLSVEARETGLTYADGLTESSFDGEILAPHLLLAEDSASPETAGLEEPDDWSTIWRVEVGLAMNRVEADRLEKLILSEMADAVTGLYSTVQEVPSRPGMYRLVFGPVPSMQEAVSRCILLKRKGHDCFAKPPG